MSIRKTAYEDGLHRTAEATTWLDQERKAIEGSDAVIAVSDVLLEKARRQGHRLPDISHVHPNYIPERFIPKVIPKPEHQPKKKSIRIVYEGFISNNNGHYDLRAIFRALAAQGLEVHIYPSRGHSSYQALAKREMNITYHQSLRPKVLYQEMTKYDFGWAGFNASLNRSHLDTVLPNKLFEYIACGLPVISFAHEALKNFLEAHNLGLVIDDIQGLHKRLQASDMVGVRENVQRRHRDFTVEVNIGMIVDIYRKLCEY
jgi:glycosyltransferase involved in cell wall biosynthesis